MQVPKLEKIVINVGLGEATKNAKLLDSVIEEIGLITGQKAVIRRAKKAISNFGLRQGMPVGVSVTLRRVKMWEFMDRFINVARSPGSATSAGCRPVPSTGAATTRWA
jgi:large subunit ribosomal protein L5